MAKGKNKVIVYPDWISQFENITDEEAGKLIKHFFRYINDQNPEPEDRITGLLFEPIKTTLKRDLKSWEETLEQRSISGRIGNLKRYYPDIFALYESENITLDQAEKLAKTRKTSHSDNMRHDATKVVAKLADNVNDNVNDINNKLLLSEIKISDDSEDLEFYKIAISFYKLFLRNREKQGITSHKTLLKTRYVDSIKIVKDILQKDKVTIEQLRNIHDLLSSETKQGIFWSKNIQSLSSLREKSDKLITDYNLSIKELKSNKKPTLDI